jgi:hypothetical protein
VPFAVLFFLQNAFQSIITGAAREAVGTVSALGMLPPSYRGRTAKEAR